jgi:hypothetical protein
MSPALAHLSALVASELNAQQAMIYAGLNMPNLALRERAKAVVIYDRTLVRWSDRHPQPTTGSSPTQR